VSDPVWVEERDALALHDRLLALDGGAGGMREPDLLKSALVRPQQIRAYGDKSDIVDMAAAYTVGIIRDHPFVDGNKRTGFVVGVLFLEMNGYLFTATEEGSAEAVLSLAAGILDEIGFSGWMRANVRRL
jgi:death-on-curing protein